MAKIQRILRKLVIHEISGVDKPAQEHARVVLMKRDSSRDEMVDAGQRHGGNGVVDFKKMMPTEDSVALQKLIDDGELKLSKAEIHEVIEKRAEQLREDGETLQQSYVKFITADPAGRVLFKAYQSAPIGKAKAPEDAKQDYVPRDEHIGVEHARLAALADHAVMTRPGMSRRQAIANILEGNASFAERIKQEKLDHEMRR